MKNILIGMAVGDAVGVPFEFISRENMEKNPCTDMIGYGTHDQPIGTWSDDTSMALCMLESLVEEGWNLQYMGDKYVNWYKNGYMTPYGEVFDMGGTTQIGIREHIKGILPPNCCGDSGFTSNGNGSVMRILPIVPYFIHTGVEKSIIRYKMVSDLSSMTHGHQLSAMSCFILTEFARRIYGMSKNPNKKVVLELTLMNVALEIASIKDILPFNHKFFGYFEQVLNEKLGEYDIHLIKSGGFAVDTVTAAIYCLLTTDNYRDAVLKAVNMGDDTDTTACVTGGLAGILYGIEGIPTDWVGNLARKDDLIELADKYEQRYNPTTEES